MGVEYRPRTRVTDISVANGRVQSVSTRDGEIEAGRVLLATGPWTTQLLNPIGIDLPIVPEFHEVAILRNAPDMKGGGCACIDSVHTVYFRSDAHDKTLIGDFYGQRGSAADPDNFAQRPSDDWLEEILEKASTRIPKLQN